MSNDFNIDQVISVDFEADSELNVQVGSVFQGASIDDNVISTKKTWSSQKINNELDLKANTSSLATVATSGSFDDLSNKPTVDTSLSDSSNNAIANSVVKGALDNKANSSDVYTKTQVYTKTEVDNALATLPGAWEGTLAEYNAILEKDPDTVYYITDTNVTVGLSTDNVNIQTADYVSNNL